jgi:tRNA dimethylallyltransferase
MNQSKLVVLVGETASGKTELAIRLAEQFDGEIICADSWTVRRGVDIGTAKPTAEERARVPHHLLDVVGPDEDFTAAVFKDLANAAIADIVSRGKLPIMVGGTGLYIDGVLYNYGFLSQGDRETRKLATNVTNSTLLEMIAARGLSTEGIDIRNKRRLIRLLETNGARPTKNELRKNTLLLGLKVERDVLQARIEQRVDHMLEAGLEDEVRGLVERYGWDCEALKGVGYAQWRGYFLGTDSRAEVRKKIIKATLELAKRQRTWFKRNTSIHWFDTPVKWQRIVDSTTTFLDK